MWPYLLAYLLLVYKLFDGKSSCSGDKSENMSKHD